MNLPHFFFKDDQTEKKGEWGSKKIPSPPIAFHPRILPLTNLNNKISISQKVL
jgi:hypothetical protein